MTVDIVIVTWNSATTIEECLTSLRLRSQDAWRVHVIDNGSHDTTLQILAEHPDRALFRVTANPANLGLAAANNQGIRAGSADIVVIANPDLVFADGCIEALEQSLQQHPRAAFAVARLNRPDGGLQTSIGDLPSLGDALLGRIVRRRGGPRRRTWWTDSPHDQECQIGHGQEACYAVRRSAIDDVGLQDARYRLDWEGYDWSARMSAAGWELWFAPTARATHVGGVSLAGARYRWVFSSHLGMYHYFAGQRPPFLRPLLALAIGARGLVKSVVVFLDSQAHTIHPS